MRRAVVVLSLLVTFTAILPHAARASMAGEGRHDPVGLPPDPPRAGPDGEWQELAPPRRPVLGTVFDSSRGRLIAFGAWPSATWAFTPEGGWSQIAALGSPPSGQFTLPAVYDPLRDRVIVFSGDESGSVMVLSLAGGPAWSVLPVAGAPPDPRWGHTLVHDPGRDRILLHGGSDLHGWYGLGDTWELTLGAEPRWTPLPTLGGPVSGRFLHAAIYDPVGDRMIVFGGTPLWDETWQLPLSGPPQWSRIVPSGRGPGVVREAAAVYDGEANRMLVFGGEGGCTDAGCARGELAALALSGEPRWSTVLPFGSGPSPRRAAGMVRDPARGVVIVHGGNDVVDQYADTWVARLGASPTWELAAACPRERTRASMVYDSNRGRALIFGGTAHFCTFTCTSWGFADVFEHSGSGWREVPVPPGPSARVDHSAIYDPARDRMLVFGGAGAGGWLADTWELSFAAAPAWRRLIGAHGEPPARQQHTAVHDVDGRRMVVFGGLDAVSARNDVWLFSLVGEPRWVELIPEGPAPRGRSRHVAVYDPVRRRMVSFGGEGGGSRLDDVWALDLGGTFRWTALQPAGIGPGSNTGWLRAVYDPVYDRMIVRADHRPEVYALEFSPTLAWRTLRPVAPGPSGYGGVAVAYDDDLHRLLTFGGGGAYGEYYNDIWALRLGEPQGFAPAAVVPPPAPSAPRSGVAGVPGLAIQLAAPAPVVAVVHGVDGRRVRALPDASFGAGEHVIRWDGRDDAGQRLPSGIYWIHARTPERSFVRKVLHLR